MLGGFDAGSPGMPSASPSGFGGALASGGAFGSGGGGFEDDAFGGGFGGSGRGSGSGGQISEDDCRAYAQAFERCKDADGFVMPQEATRQLERSELPREVLFSIWDLSDQDRDGRLSFREFVCAMHLAGQAARGQPLPSEVLPDWQEALARPVKRSLSRSGLESADPLGGSKPRADEWSTADTTTSDPHGHRKGRSRKHRDGGDRSFAASGAFDTRDSAVPSSMFDRTSDMGAQSELSTTGSRIAREDQYGSRGHGGQAAGSHKVGSGRGFDTPGSLENRRGRDPTPRSTNHQVRSERLTQEALAAVTAAAAREGSPDPRGLPDDENSGLGQLASVFKVIARLDSGNDLSRLSREVLEERHDLERQLARRRDFERQLQESHSRLEALREDRRRVEIEKAAAQRNITHLQDEMGFVEREVKDAEEDLTLLRESGDLTRDGSNSKGRRGPAPYSSGEDERRDVLSKVRAEKELLQKDQRAIEEYRSRLEDIFKRKTAGQELQQSLLEKQRQTEQDRGLMLTAIEAERGKLSAMRADRLRMWEERSVLEREMSEIQQESWLVEHRAAPRVPLERGPGPGMSGAGVPDRDGRNVAPKPQRAKGIRHEEAGSQLTGSRPEWDGPGDGGPTSAFGSNRDTRGERTGAPAAAERSRGIRNGDPGDYRSAGPNGIGIGSGIGYDSGSGAYGGTGFGGGALDGLSGSAFDGPSDVGRSGAGGHRQGGFGDGSLSNGSGGRSQYDSHTPTPSFGH